MMTSLGYQGMIGVLARLDRVRWRHRLVQVLRAVAALLTVVLATAVVLGAACGYWPDQPPALLRWGLLFGALTGWTLAAILLVVLPISRGLNHAQAARLVEREIPGLDNGLINALQLSQDRQQEPTLVEKVIEETVRRTAPLPLASAVKLVSLWRWSIAAAVAAAGVALFWLLQGPRLARGLSAVFNPTGYVRHVGSLKLVWLTPGDVTLFAGESLTVSARVENPRQERLTGLVKLLPPGANGKPAEPSPRAMLASPDAATFTCRVGKVDESFDYYVQIGDSRFPQDRPACHVTVLQRVDVEGLDLLYSYPPYTRLPENAVVTQAGKTDGDIKAPLGTQVAITLRLSAPVPNVILERKGGEKLAMPPDETGRSYSAGLRITGDDAYRILLADAAGRRLQQLPDPASQDEDVQADGMYAIRAIPDAPPRIEFTEPRADASVGPGGKLPTRLKAGDDYGLGTVRFFLGRQGEPARVVQTFDRVVGTPSAELDYTVALGGEYREGDCLVYYAAATDQRPTELGGPQTTETTPRMKIRVEDPVKLAAAKAERYDKLRARLLALLEAQEKQRVNTDLADRKLADLPAIRATGKQIVAGQTTIKLDMFDLVEHFPFDPEMQNVKTALAELGNNEASLAISQAVILSGLPDLSARGEACRDLAASQDKIIRSLQWMLAMMPSWAKPEVAQKTAAGTELPPDAMEKLLDLKQQLDKFTDEQRKAIQATQNLAKKPADDFTPADEKLLKDLQAVQDKWEKFLNEQFADFSKMAQQDFSKPALLQELISVKTDVTMAKDALQKKATEIATAIEDNGVENAKTLTANIEKWLPDQPDRIKWDMEDPAGQAKLEQAETPKELEDLVGDLLEKEEELFTEMEDVTSKYAQSGDKGIGWDAMDGPISNMNAQGVTGNQLPNTSEISGRSGEGRQGKATGEFVEDKAVGKGGRRTPTRLTPEPFQQGQINDTSEEPAGGSTGGGKLSGAGGEGLEGPLPPQLQELVKRIAGKHAQLLNRAERVEAGMKVSDYSNYQFHQVVTLMNRVQGDLERYRYANALRAKQVLLSDLRQTLDGMKGKIDVTTDTTGLMPKKVRDDIADAMNAKLPPEYQDALKRYFNRLSATGAAGPTSQPAGPTSRPAGK